MKMKQRQAKWDVAVVSQGLLHGQHWSCMDCCVVMITLHKDINEDIAWTKNGVSKELCKWLRTMKIIHSYPSLPNVWHQEMMMMTYIH